MDWVVTVEPSTMTPDELAACHTGSDQNAILSSQLIRGENLVRIRQPHVLRALALGTVLNRS